MKRSLILLSMMGLLSMQTLLGQQKQIFAETPAQQKQRMAWWTDARFGMFLHWGLYSGAARHEWVKNYERLTNEQYQKYFDRFNPDLFDPNAWARTAKAAGMKYMVLTTKHHEGFCLFDSKFTDYKSTNTQAKRDLVKEYVTACRANGMKVGFYYSLLDWHHPDYTVDRNHPQRVSGPKADSAYAAMNKGKNMAKYRAYLKNQVTELLTNYGKIDILWLDFSFPNKDGHGKNKDDWGSLELIKLVRKLQPGIIINNRLNLEEYRDGADFETPEQVKPAELEKYKGKLWETCQTFSGSWGYYRDENTWKTHRQLLDLLITSTANGGNLILNVGPTGRGEFDYRATRALDSLGFWMHANSRSIYNCTYPPAEFKVPDNSDRITYDPVKKILYLHLFTYPDKGQLTLPGYGGKIKYAQFVHDSSELKMTDAGSDLALAIPKRKPIYEVPVIALFLE